MIISVFGGIGIIGFILIIIALIYKNCKCCKKRKLMKKTKKINHISSTEQQLELIDPNESLKSSLIPPLFFTQGIRDPLYQADLVDHLNTPKK